MLFYDGHCSVYTVVSYFPIKCNYVAADASYSQKEKGAQMSNSKIVVLARLKANDGMEEQVRNALLSIVEETRLDPGCLSYDVHQAKDDKTCFMFFENWTGMDAFSKHMKEPFMAEFADTLKPFLAEPGDLTLWECIS